MIPLNVAFRRSLTGVNLQAWHNVVAMVTNIQLTNRFHLETKTTSQNQSLHVVLVQESNSNQR
jgi:hypothetical protein